jgi:hypothetical protein
MGLHLLITDSNSRLVRKFGEIGKTCPKCGRFFLGNECPDCGWKVLEEIPRPMKEKKKRKIEGIF